MIDAEKLLGKVLSGAIQSGGKKKKKRKKRKKSDDLMDSVLGGLTSGKGLVTAIGLGVGAYEIMRSKKAAAQPPQGSWGGVSQHSAPVPPAAPATPPTPPPVPGQSVSPAPSVPAASQSNGVAELEQGPVDELAVLLIQTMVAAAHADGRLDHVEEEQILKTLQEQGLDAEEKRYIISQLHSPKSIAELTVSVEDPTVAHTMYSLACATIVIDTEEERQWLDQFATALSISKAMQSFLEEDV